VLDDLITNPTRKGKGEVGTPEGVSVYLDNILETWSARGAGVAEGQSLSTEPAINQHLLMASPRSGRGKLRRLCRKTHRWNEHGGDKNHKSARCSHRQPLFPGNFQETRNPLLVRQQVPDKRTFTLARRKTPFKTLQESKRPGVPGRNKN